MTSSEKIVFDLCKNSFLSFWSFYSPIGKKDKELCDVLVVCEPDIIIFSIKEINVIDSGNIDTDIERWTKKAIKKSTDQIYGAERIINLQEEILLNDGKTIIKLPKTNFSNIYRIAVAFGRGEKFPLSYGDFGKGFVHVFDEISIKIILRELDTIRDFIDFLNAKQQYLTSNIRQIATSGEDYLALYLQNGNQFPKGIDLLFLGDDLWEGYSKTLKYKKEKEENRISYVWDGIIENLYSDFISGTLLQTISRENLELAIRDMNKESRFSRRQISQLLKEVIGTDSGEETVNSRIVKPDIPNANVYVFLTRPYEIRENRIKELEMRCFVARSLYQDAKIVIGIATEKYKKGQGFSLDICYHNFPVWTKENQIQAEQLKSELNLFNNLKISIKKSNE